MPLCGQRPGRVEDLLPGAAPRRPRSLPRSASPRGPRPTSCLHGSASSPRFLHTSHTHVAFVSGQPLVPCVTRPGLVRSVACRRPVLWLKDSPGPAGPQLLTVRQRAGSGPLPPAGGCASGCGDPASPCGLPRLVAGHPRSRGTATAARAVTPRFTLERLPACPRGPGRVFLLLLTRVP